MDALGVPLFLETPIRIYIYIYILFFAVELLDKKQGGDGGGEVSISIACS